jgi:hypothetical protein
LEEIKVSEEVWTMPEKAHRIFQADAVEAHGRPGVFVQRDPVTQRASISDPEEFRIIARYLDEKG